MNKKLNIKDLRTQVFNKFELSENQHDTNSLLRKFYLEGYSLSNKIDFRKKETWEDFLNDNFLKNTYKFDTLQQANLNKPSKKIAILSDSERREIAVFGRKIDWKTEGFGGCMSFNNLDTATLGKLLEEKLADPDEQQNNSPTIDEFYYFAKMFERKYDAKLSFQGYLVCGKREDSRISIDGIECNSSDDYQIEYAAIKDFFLFADSPDDISILPLRLRAWWD